VSERPTMADAGQPRPRWSFHRLRDLPIWSKLGLIMIVPTLATIIVGTNGLISHTDTHNNAQRARVLALLSDASGELVHHLQDERASAVMLLGASGSDEIESRVGSYTGIQGKVDEAQAEYQRHRTGLTDLPAGFRSTLSEIGGRLSGLPQLRSRVAAGELGLADASASYEELINGLINIRDSSAQLSGEAVLGDRMRAAASIARTKEFLSRQRVVGHEVLIRQAYHPHLRTAFIGTQTGQQQAQEQFNAVATAAERALLEQNLDGPDVRQSILFQDYLDSLEGEQLGTPPWDADAWDAVMAAHANLLREIERQLDEQVVIDATALRDAVIQRLLIETGALLAMLLLAILFAWLVARSMAQSLRELRHGALEVAQYGLPQAVARLRDPALSTQLSPVQVASQIAEPLPVRSKDEFGQVTEAFNAVHLEAVRTAAEQASLRSSVATMFVNLARRSQILVDRLIGHLDRLERGEEDPDRLAELFQLDHLATRMRRNDENLLVLAGADSTRVQREPASLVDVLRAAQSEVEHYTRIEFGVVDRDIEITAHAVNDLVHLVAELFDNATAFSPPDSVVTVEARRVGDRCVLYVEDQGLGLSHEQLADINERLATPPLVDVAVSRMMGLVVVSRLAARHRVKVELRRRAEGGTVADVTLPASLLVPRALTDGPIGGQLASRSAGAESYRGAGEPRALESGPAGERLRPISAPPVSAPSFPAPPVSGPPHRFDPPSFAVPGVPRAEPAPDRRPEHDQQAPTRPGSRLPAWSDLTGVAGPNGSDQPSGPLTGPLPQRRPGVSRTTDDSPAAPGTDPAGTDPAGTDPAGTDGTRAIPRQRPVGPSERHGSAAGTTAAPALPTWPPLPSPPASVTPDAGDPHADDPDEAAPAPDRAGGSGPALAGTVPGVPAYAPPPRESRTRADETMELPIFAQLESAWFRAPRPSDKPTPAPADTEPDGSATTEFAAVGAAGARTGDAVMGMVVGGATPDGQPTTSDGGSGASQHDWRTAADDGWRAASSLAAAEVDEKTAAGLPKRRPMAQLVPGGVDTAQTGPGRRSPEAVRGLLSAYHRGVQRGRMQNTSDERSAQAGKEQGA
jgi:methyl-accepting chemotaxis protein/anti-sigma regulatory factor (Ser/Thr protein kinase)